MTIDVEYLKSDWHITYLTRDHIAPEVMRAAVLEAEGGEVSGFCDPRHEWWRRFPKWDNGMRVQWYQQAQPNSRGAFRCTVMVKDW